MNRLSWEVVLAVAFISGIYLLWIMIRRLIRLPASVTEHTLPVIPHQKIEFIDIGEKYLHVEGPRFTTVFSGISFALSDGSTNLPVRLRSVILRSVMGGMSRAKLLLKTFVIDHAGSYGLQIGGIKEGVDYSNTHIVITKPYLAKLTLNILGLILAGWLVIGSIVLSILLLTHTL